MIDEKKIIVQIATIEQSQEIHDLIAKDIETNPELIANKKKGFLSYLLSVKEIEDMIIKDQSLLVAMRNGRVIAYAGRFTSSYVSTLDRFNPLLQYVSKIEYDGKKLLEYRYVVGAGTCVAEEARGGRAYFKVMTATKKNCIDMGIELFIAILHVDNHYSLATSTHAGFKVVDDQYIDKQGTRWYIVIMDLRENKAID